MTLRNRRPGVSLTEALVATGIMAIGLLSLLALLPVGAMRMAEAFRADRTGQLAANADNLARILWKTAWIDPVSGSLKDEINAVQSEGALGALSNPGAGWYGPAFTTVNPPPPGVATSAPAPSLPTDYELDNQYRALTTGPPAEQLRLGASTPSYAVFLDPVGFHTKPANQRWWVGADATGAFPNTWVPRRGLALAYRGIETVAVAQVNVRTRLCSIRDDIGFSNGGDSVSSTGALDRGGRYNCAWLVQRLKNNVRSEVNVHVVVYENRPVADIGMTEVSLQHANAGNTGPQATIPTTIAGAPATSVTVWTGGARPPIKRGGWILICGVAFVDIPGTGQVRVPKAEFYRVVGISEPNNNTLQLELAIPIRNTTNGQPLVQGRIVFMERVVEEFDRGTISATAPPAP